MAAMTTKRTPIRPPGGKRITPAAVAAFRQMQRLEESCNCQHDCKDGDCEEWNRLDRTLRDEMKLYPWEFPTYLRRTNDGRDADAVVRYHMLKAAADEAAS
jgi:hypothetical protein